MYNRAQAMDAAGHTAVALTGYGGLIDRFGNSNIPEVQVDVASAMLNRAGIMSDAGNRKEALAEYDRLIARFESSHIPEVLEVIGYAKMNLKNSETVLQSLSVFSGNRLCCRTVKRRYRNYCLLSCRERSWRYWYFSLADQSWCRS